MATNERYGSTAGLGTLNDADFDFARRPGDEVGSDFGRSHGTGSLERGFDIDAARRELGSLGDQLDKLKVAARQGAGRVDTHVHVSPYPYVLGAFGLGLIAGSLLAKRPLQ